MPRGKNYVNNNRGMALQASSKKSPKMIDCQYGAGCTRSDCIYRHPNKKQGAAAALAKSNEPCMAYLAGICTFSGGGCRKRHPPKQEAERLIERYQRIKCRHGDKCLTKGCLYRHPSDKADHVEATESTPSYYSVGAPSYPSYAAMAVNPTCTPVASAWKPVQPGLMSSHQSTTTMTSNNGSLSASAKEWTPSWQT